MSSPFQGIPVDHGFVTVLDFALAGICWRDYDGVISIEDVETSRRLRVPAGSRTDHLVLQFDDIDFDDGISAIASRQHLDDALAFARRHAGGRLMVHCQAGQCRSPAIALAILADRFGPGEEARAISELLRIRPIAAPNLVALRHADEALGREGRLEAAWLAHEATDDKLARLRFLRGAAAELFDPVPGRKG